MKYFDWDPVKNELIKAERGISFEEVIIAIFEGRLLTVINHPNQKKYPDQKIFVVELHDYAFLVPFVEDKQKIFLKTIFPSRRYTREYLEKGAL